MQKQQVFNPFLPLGEYVPDGEPHIFGDRVYIFGSHDREGGYTFCMDDYVTYSAPVTDLSDWRYEGVIYKATQDPQYEKLPYMYAPDVVQGNDGRYYLYYSMSGEYGVGGYIGPMSVAVADQPAGPYEFLGFVQYPDGRPMERFICFDPGVINDDGVIRMYYGTSYGFEEEDDFPENPAYLKMEEGMFGKTREELLSYPDTCMGPVVVTLCDDMLTVKDEPRQIIPYKVKGTPFEKHAFFEASSIRKVGEKYYFIYSSRQNHELCYAVSDKPDRDFVYGGTVVSNGDIGFEGKTREQKMNMTGTTHGSIIQINGQWYVFYHRLTHKSDYSRQACAEKIEILPDGSIPQAGITSCGLNEGPLKAEGSYPAVICCHLTNGRMPHGTNSVYTASFPNVTNLGEDRFIGEICNDTLIGYRYFDYRETKKIGILVRAEKPENMHKPEGPVRVDDRCKEENKALDEAEKKVLDSVTSDETFFEIRLTEKGDCIGKIDVAKALSAEDPMEWKEFSCDVTIPDGAGSLYLVYHGKQKMQLKEIRF